MLSDILLGIAGIEMFPVVSLVLFVTVFGVMLVRVARMDRRGVERLAALPLDESPEPTRRDTGGSR
jgi:cytochrome c oxidase cbb3-type subunit IV